jgi:predicted NBD/HSP70 family sugar kinase/predicted transcriptional regulator
MRSQSFLEMRRRNALAIVSIVRGEREISRAELAREANLSPATVSNIVDELLEAGVLIETGSKSSTSQRGRRPIGLIFNPTFAFAAGMSLDSTRLKVVICDLDGNLIAESASDCNLHAGYDQLASSVMESLKEIAKKASIPVRKICALGLALPSGIERPSSAKPHPVSKATGAVQPVELWARLQKKLKRAIVLDSHVNMSAIAESSTGGERHSDVVMVVRLGHVVHSALVVHGQLLAGSSGLAGELGHLPSPGNRRNCECGNVGCINTIATPGALLKVCQERGARVKELDDVISEAERGNRACRDTLTEAASSVGFGIAAAINILAPQQIIISGPLVEAKEIFLVPLYSAIRQHALKTSYQNCIVSTSELRHLAEPLGAALKALSMEPRLLLFGTPSEMSPEEEEERYGLG